MPPAAGSVPASAPADSASAPPASVRLAAGGGAHSGRLARPGWLRPWRTRLAVFWPAKLLGLTLGLTAFFVAYFWILKHPAFPVTTMPRTALDRAIGFQPWALPLYLSLWFYLSLAPGLLIDRRELLSYGGAALALSVTGLGLFLVWPTAVPPGGAGWSQQAAFVFLQSVDASGNACPSLHVAFAVFTAIWLDRLAPRVGAGWALRALNWLWAIGIAYSTLATGQHVVLDVLAGAGLGAGFAFIHFRWLRTFPGPRRACAPVGRGS